MEGLATYLAGDNTTSHYYAGAGSTPKLQGNKVKKKKCKSKTKGKK